MSKILVTGGCGYIGSHTIVDLINNGFEVISIDNFSRSHSSTFESIKKITGKDICNYNVDLKDKSATEKVFEENPEIVGIIHFAAYKLVFESTEDPLLYYENNLGSLNNILHCCRKFNVKNFVFSSSCSVYGNAEKLPVNEEEPMKKAESPYANTKQMGEEIIENFNKSFPFNYMLLRYFNPAGAHPSAEIGELPIDRPQNLVPYISKTATGELEQLSVFGNDYPTKDGTCVRDYIHVMDVAGAHVCAMKKIINGNPKELSNIYNLGAGEGKTVFEAVTTFEQVNKLKLNWKYADRRPGDVIAIYGDNKKAKAELDWELKYSFEDIMKTAYEWELKLKERNLKLY